jgi:hypothetical protein
MLAGPLRILDAEVVGEVLEVQETSTGVVITCKVADRAKVLQAATALWRK